MFNQNRRLTISIEPTEVRLTVAEEQQILHWASAPLPNEAVQNGQIARPTPFGEVVDGLIKELDAPRRRAVVSLNGHGALVRTIDMPAVPPKMLDEAVRRKARRELPLPLEELYLSWQVIDRRGDSRLRVFTLGVPRETIDRCMIGLRGIGIRPLAMGLKPLALVRAVNRPNVLLANLEQDSGSVVLVRDFVPYIVRSLIPPTRTERSPVEQASDLIVEMQRVLDFYNSTVASEHPAWSPVVCLTGKMGSEEEVQARVEAHWPLVEPSPPLTVPEGLPLSAYLVNIGLILKETS